MTYADLQEFKRDVSTSDPVALVQKWITADKPHAFSDTSSYREFIKIIESDWPESELIQIAGSGNWRYSLNPKNQFREFNPKSDIDVIIVSQFYFNET